MSGHACPCTAACFVRKSYISCSSAESVSDQHLARDERVTAHTLHGRAITHAQNSMQGVLWFQVHKKGQPRCETTLATLHRVAKFCCTFPGMPVGYRAYFIIVYNFTMSIAHKYCEIIHELWILYQMNWIHKFKLRQLLISTARLFLRRLWNSLKARYDTCCVRL